MSEQVTVTLSESILECASQWSRRTGRSLEDVLAGAIELSLIPLNDSADAIDQLSDENVLAAADATMNEADDSLLSELLDQQQRGVLANSEVDELRRLMQIYQSRLLRKAEALREAVRRGLRPPVQS